MVGCNDTGERTVRNSLNQMLSDVHSKFDELIALWHSKPKSDAGAPLRKEFDWSDFSSFYGWVVIYEVENPDQAEGRAPLPEAGPADAPLHADPTGFGHTARFLVRMIGTNVARVHKADHTGKYLDLVFPRDKHPFVFAPIEQAVAEIQPVVTDHPVPVLGGYDMRLTKLLLPFSSNGEQVDHVMGVLYYSSLDPKIGSI